MRRSSLHIVMLAPFGIRPKGTLSARMLPLAQALVRRGHHVNIIAPPVQNPQDAGRRDCYDGVLVEHTPLPVLPGPLGVAEQVLALLRAALTVHPDVLHLFKPKGYSGLAALLAQAIAPGLPLVVDTDDWEGWADGNDLLPYPWPAKALFAWQEHDLPRHAAAVTVVSRTLEAQVQGFGVPPERIVYVPNGMNTVDHVPLVKPMDVPTMLLYTRFWEFDVRDVVATLVGVAQHIPHVRLLIVGLGERGEESVLLHWAQRAGVANNIDYRGWVEPEHLPALLQSAMLALVPMNDTLINRARGLAKLLELMAAGLPIVAGRVGQVAEYLEDGRSGLLVPPADGGAMAAAAIRLLGGEELRHRLGAAARERATRLFHWDVLAGDVERAYAIALRHTLPVHRLLTNCIA